MRARRSRWCCERWTLASPTRPRMWSKFAPGLTGSNPGDESRSMACAAAAVRVSLAREGGGGGQGQNRTADTGIFNPLLYRLSYLAPRFSRAMASAILHRPNASKSTVHIYRCDIFFTAGRIALRGGSRTALFPSRLVAVSRGFTRYQLFQSRPEAFCAAVRRVPEVGSRNPNGT